MTMATSFLPAGARKRVMLEAMTRLTALQSVVSSARVFDVYLVDSRGVLLAHRDQQQIVRRIAATWLPKLESLDSGRSASMTIEYARTGTPLIGGFARITAGGLLVGVEIPKEAAYLTAQDLLAHLLVVALGLLIVAALLSTFWSRRITSPLEQLSGAARIVGTGRFDIQLQKSSQDEIGDLADSFNQMASELARHERELKETQLALVQSEKMAAFGQLGAGIAHEVKNPLAGILGFAQLSLRKAEKDTPLFKNLEVIEKETKRCKNIIENLLKFARQETVAFQPTDINQVVEDAVVIMDHQLGIHHIKVHKDLVAGLPPIMGNANQIQQVLMNLMINAQQALDGKAGDVRIATRLRDDGHVEVRIKDSGPGIPKEIQSRLFEPFFTTKPAGKGTGLGLSVSYGIVKDHKGEIMVRSEAGNGAEFIIILPQLAVEPARAAEAAPAERT
jgi:signal transduction histidine kinase